MIVSQLVKRGVFGRGGGTGGGAGQFTPANVVGLKCWLKADGTLYQESGRTNLVTTSGQGVGSIDDASGLANHALQTVDTRELLYTTGVQNALPGLFADNVATKTAHTASIAHGIGTGDFYVAFVVRITNGTGATERPMGSLGSFAPAFYVQNNKARIYLGGYTNFNTTAVPTTGATLIEWWRTGTTLRCAVNDTTDATTITTSGNFGSSGFNIFAEGGSGGGVLVEGYFFEAILVAGSDAANQQTSLRSYFKARWGY